MKKGILIFASLAGLLARPAWAEQSIKARDLIQQIFGVDAETLASAIATAGQGNSILGNVASIVNSVAMLGAAIIVLLTLTNGLLQTGEHGKIMGRYSAIWVPLRTMIAAALLAPLSLHGYSMLQALVLWGGMQGSTYADQGWQYANSYMAENLRLSTPVGSKATASVVQNLYAMEVCGAAVARAGEAAGHTFGIERESGFQGHVVESGTWWGLGDPTRTSVQVLNYRGTGSYANTDALCGRLTLAHTQGSLGGGEAGLYWQGQEQVQMRNLADLQTRLRQLAEQVVAGDMPGEAVRESLRTAEISFADAELRRLAMFNSRLDGITEDIRQNQLAKASSAGWVGAGGWYMTFAGMASEMSASLADEPVFEPARLDQMTDSLRADVGPVVARSGSVWASDLGSPLNLDTPPEMGDWDVDVITGWLVDKMLAKGMGLTRQIFDQLMAISVADGADPVVSLASVGQGLIAGVGVIFLTFTAIAAGAIGVTGGTAALPAFMLGMALLPVLIIVATVGAFLAYLLPAMPYAIWIAGVAGWLLMMVQMVVAAPLWAASHALPEGEGFAGHRAQQGYMLLISLLARPLLMVVGLVSAMLVARVMGTVVVTTFGWFTSSAQLGTVGNPMHLLIWICLFAGLFIVITRWSFSLIHLVPDAVLRLIGAAAESLGETHIADQVKQMTIQSWMMVKGAGSVSGGLGKLGSLIGKK